MRMERLTGRVHGVRRDCQASRRKGGKSELSTISNGSTAGEERTEKDEAR
jgi:hypothetical protein